MRPVTLLAFATCLAVAACSSDDDCDAAKDCANKTDRIFTTSKVAPLCGVDSTASGAQYSWKTDQGTCTCTLDSRANGNFWRNCSFK